ncbi:glycosyltransferase involved in cell wall biosynthesis [Algoriphagus ratkowskyi]|uniref:Glycosyltransferase family 4 protein n=1 Tax=Algoriphagus ratkowskyi TaxID=57028 RepID=A0A2W7SGE9_9BACT|nr:glycosyltransferase family 4 protein [Algoriphagus ratkowskyi]PZX49802.1 glycosyltransferase involved in cell wall biosynthesis [Algoriphagus ratkowskyi]TXD75478.1 glycosyltransferase family 4 protein [Algoriphagus ratkowskyi]
MRKKILIALHRFVVGGAETQALYLAKELRNNGFEVIIGAFGTEVGEGLDRFKHEDFTCVRWGFQEKLILYPAKTISGFIRKWRYTWLLINKVRSLGIDIVIPYTYPANFVFCRWFKRMNVKRAFWNQRDEGRQFLGSSFEKRVLRNASHIITNSLEGYQFLNQFTSEPIHLIPNGIDVNKFTSSDHHQSSKNVVMIGNIHGYKDHITLIHAWQIVAQQFPEYKLLLAGRAGDTFEVCEKFVIDLKLQESIRFLGVVSDISSLLSNCSIAVFSSNNEGVPNGILEPMAASLPVVSTNIQGAKEALGEKYPFLVESGNSNQFAGFIIRLLSDPDLRKEIGSNNRIRLQQNFSIAKMTKGYIHLLNV